jgi:hypothetical protein
MSLSLPSYLLVDIMDYQKEVGKFFTLRVKITTLSLEQCIMRRMIELLGRAGLLDEAVALIRKDGENFIFSYSSTGDSSTASTRSSCSMMRIKIKK